MKKTHHWQWAVTLCSSLALCGTLAAQTPTSTTPPQGGQPTSTPQSGRLLDAAERSADHQRTFEQ